MSPRTPFPSFTLALSRQAAGENESNIGMQERNVEPPIDLMVGHDYSSHVFSFLPTLTLSLDVENI